MKNILTSALLFFIFSISLSAQREVVDVIVHVNDKQSEEGLMEYNPSYPWAVQRSVSIFDKSLRNAKKVKKKDKTEYKAKDIQGLQFNGKVFEVHKIAATGNSEYASTIGGLVKPTLIEKIEDGAISMYRVYGYPPKVASGVDFNTIYEDLRNKPEYYVEKDHDGELKAMNNINIEKWIADAPETSKKFADGEYGNFKRKEGKKFANFIKGQLENESSGLILKVVRAYNEEMTKE